MTPSKRNEMTLSILSELRKRGAPVASPIPLDMGFGEEEELEELGPDGRPLPRKLKRKPVPEPTEEY